MSEDAKAPDERPAGPAAAAAATPAKGGPKIPPLVLLIAVVVLALGAGAAAGALLVAPRIIHARQAALADAGHGKGGKARKKPRKESRSGKEGEGKTPVYKLENIIVNPADSQGQRFLMCSIAIESDDPKVLDGLREHEIELRDHVVTLLAAQSLESLTAPGARDSLRARLLAAIRPTLGADDQDAELQVFLPQFVIQ